MEGPGAGQQSISQPADAVLTGTLLLMWSSVCVSHRGAAIHLHPQSRLETLVAVLVCLQAQLDSMHQRATATEGKLLDQITALQEQLDKERSVRSAGLISVYTKTCLSTWTVLMACCFIANTTHTHTRFLQTLAIAANEDMQSRFSVMPCPISSCHPAAAPR